ncbi:MAG: molybdopterin synthase sulfur carrier subunit [Planctomycetaceae bacterium]|nr:molybdopterin synthase sulfur carrier subunit [Planctomycetaceae bacterium]
MEKSQRQKSAMPTRLLWEPSNGEPVRGSWAMQITVKLMGFLKEKTPPGNTITLVDPTTVEELLNALDVPSELVQVTTINGSFEQDRSRQLADGDELSVIPPVGGG